MLQISPNVMKLRRMKTICSRRHLRIVRNIVIILSLSFLLINLHKTYNNPIEYIFINTGSNDQCTLPDLDPFDPSILKFKWHPDPIKCSSVPNVLYIDEEGFLQLNKSAVSNVDMNKTKCTYSIVKRVDDNSVEFLQPKEIKFPIFIQSDFFLIECKNQEGKVIFNSLLEHIDYKSTLESKNVKEQSSQQLSLVVFGLDSLSRLAAERSLPKTMKYLREVLNAYIFKGYTKVGENTVVNLIPLLAGNFVRKLPNENEFINDFGYPLIFSNFSEKGYITYYAEDFPSMSTFNCHMGGFRNPPTDHYFRPFDLAIEATKSNLKPDMEQLLMFLEDKNIRLTQSSFFCYGNRPKHQIQINYLKQFLTAYRNKRKFAFSWLNRLGHDYANFLELGDEDTMEFLKWMKEKGFFKTSIVVIISDHGNRIDSIRNTRIGRIENRMPFLSIVIPDDLKRTYPQIHKNLLINTERITTPFDVHEVFSDVLRKNIGVRKGLQFGRSLPRGISLFHEIPKNRTCANAAIPESFCACYSSVPINVNETDVQSIAQFVVYKINEKLRNVKDKCAEVALFRIRHASLTTSNFKRIPDREKFTLRTYFTSYEDEEEKRFVVTIETVPGNAMFEASVNKWRNNEYDILGDEISRTNRYGNQSMCVYDRILRTYCYCLKSKLTSNLH